MINRLQLLSDLQSLLRTVEADLLERSESRDVPEVGDWLRSEYEKEKLAGCTAQTLKIWIGAVITQVAAAWVLSCVFVRYLDDKSLVTPPRNAGLAELILWLKQWHSDPNHDFGRLLVSDYFETEFLATEA